MRLLRDLSSLIRVRRLRFHKGPAAAGPNGAPEAGHDGNSLAELVGNPTEQASRRSRRGSNVALVETKPAREETTSLVRTIGERLERHEERSERIASSLQGVPDIARGTLDALPELTRNTAALRDAFEAHAASAQAQERMITDAVTRLESLAHGHGETLALVQQQLVESEHAAHRLAETMEDVRGALHDLSGAHAATTKLVSELAHRAEEREQAMTQVTRRTQAFLVVLAGMTTVASASAVIVALVA